MDKQRLESILEAYGADPRRWPAHEREAALQASARWAEEIGDIGAEARSIDAALARSTEPILDASLRDRVVAALSAADRAATGGTIGPRRGLRPAPRWGLVAGLAAACIGGYSFAAVLERTSLPAATKRRRSPCCRAMTTRPWRCRRPRRIDERVFAARLASGFPRLHGAERLPRDGVGRARGARLP